MNEKIFALDIGTRSVVGIMMEKSDDSYKVADMVTREHEERSMLDGQIHDILSVSRVIDEVKKELEQKHGPLHKVCVAAAGRALRTKRTSIQKSVDQHPLMTYEDISHLELQAVQQAQFEIAQEFDEATSTDYYCVGYSVLHYYLDDQPIGSLIDQQGKEVTIDIIATFLPKVVVESLLSALQRSGLEMDALTLEPIAAIQVLIPPSMRRLNVALVDIGAGTSDIALTDEGTVTAYGMVPVAGDEITEAISDAYLLDFPLAEKAKRELTEHKETTMTDILGFETIVKYEEAVTEIEASIQLLADRIGDEILLMNGKSPKAVMLVGGGSQTPELTKRLADKLQLPANRVAIRGIDAVQNLEEKDKLPQGPDYVTPIGIAIAAKQSPVHYISVTVNQRTIRLFDMKSLKVGDAFLAAGIDFSKLYGKPGQAFVVTVNGKTVPLKGSFGRRPTVQINGEEASLDAPIQHQDAIEVTKGTDGEQPKVTVEDIIGDLTSIEISYNGNSYSLTSPAVFVNGRQAQGKQQINDRDSIEHKPLRNLRDAKSVLSTMGVWENTISEETALTVNGQKLNWPEKSGSLTINETSAQLDAPIKQGDSIRHDAAPALSLEELLIYHDYPMYEQIDVFFEGNTVKMHKQKIKVFRGKQSLHPDDHVEPGESLKAEEIDTEPFIFQDIFRYIDIDVNAVPKPYQLYKNEEAASFHDTLFPGDRLSIGLKSTV
ncbi:cell division protein FtsA [Halobacillus litoralis]|uniref:cell division protein FtsA n=1 Tax=Halobacillus litoralis TaxID=45668 RepID=UPI001CD308FF|nr:cell division protein FtsA [Halobacillus litoralis]MCA0972773.1 cell division protein FtsA [Halobacillus litoralis]